MKLQYFFLTFLPLATISRAAPILEQVLTKDNFESTISQGTWFVEHFSPWCGHCRSFAPLWSDLTAEAKRGDFGSVNLAKIDCSVSGDLCTAHDVRGYPQMNLYQDGKFIETFKGKRDRDRLTQFLRDASPSSGIPPIPIQPDELDLHLTQNSVLYVLVHLGASHLLNNLTPHFVNTPPIVSIAVPSPDPYKSLYARWKIPPTSPWALVALKDHDISPTSVYIPLLPNPRLTGSEADKLAAWLQANKFPTTMEPRTQEEVQGLMNAPHRPLVVIAPVSHADARARETIEEVARMYRRRRSAGAGTRDVVYVFMEMATWGEWLGRTYGVGEPNARIIIVDHSALTYVDTDVNGHPLTLTSSPRVVAGAIEGTMRGHIRTKSSESVLDKINRHPFAALAFAGLCIATLVWAAKRRRTGSV